MVTDDDASAETSTPDLDSTVEADVPIDAGPCPTLGDASMLVVTHEAGAFCMDPTEVTNAAFDAFLAATGGGRVDAGVPESGLPSGCGGVQTFGRTADSGSAAQPVAFVTWCSAYAYCAWAGKRLCKAIVGEPNNGEWAIGCTRDGRRTYSYGSTYDASACNDLGTGSVAVTSEIGCQGGFDGLFDMTGNVSEFVDACNSNQTICLAAGGSFVNGASGTCGAREGQSPAVSNAADVGFRCCANRR